MKYFLAILLFVVSFALGYRYAEGSKTIKTTVVTKTVKVGYDSSFVGKILTEKDSLKGVVEKLHSANYALLSKIGMYKNRKPTYIPDTVTLHDTTYVAYSSPFRIGTDTLNCTGIVSFDMVNFSFSDVGFQFPQRRIIITRTKEKINWFWVGASFVVGSVLGGYLSGGR